MEQRDWASGQWISIETKVIAEKNFYLKNHNTIKYRNCHTGADPWSTQTDKLLPTEVPWDGHPEGTVMLYPLLIDLSWDWASSVCFGPEWVSHDFVNLELPSGL